MQKTAEVGLSVFFWLLFFIMVAKETEETVAACIFFSHVFKDPTGKYIFKKI